MLVNGWFEHMPLMWMDFKVNSKPSISKSTSRWNTTQVQHSIGPCLRKIRRSEHWTWLFAISILEHVPCFIYQTKGISFLRQLLKRMFFGPALIRVLLMSTVQLKQPAAVSRNPQQSSPSAFRLLRI